MDPVRDEPIPTNGTQSVGAIRLVRSGSQFPIGAGVVDYISDGASSSFSVTDYSKITPGPGSIFTTIGPCIVSPLKQPDQPDNTGSVSYLDAGAVINLTGPNGEKQLPKLTPAGVISYSAMLGSTAIPGVPAGPPLYLTAGTYTATNGAGGAQVGAFTTSLTIPAEFVWTNEDITDVNRAAGFLLAGPAATRVGWSVLPELRLFRRRRRSPRTRGITLAARCLRLRGAIPFPRRCSCPFRPAWS